MLVTDFLNAYYRGDNKTARSLLADDCSFHGPGVTFEHPDHFLASSAHVAPSVRDIQVRKVFVDGSDLCAFYDVFLNHAVKQFSAAQWFTLRDGKISSIRMIFDTAPFRDAEPRAEEHDAAVDPICGMTVRKSDAAATRVRAGETYYFCNTGCAVAFDN